MEEEKQLVPVCSLWPPGLCDAHGPHDVHLKGGQPRLVRNILNHLRHRVFSLVGPVIGSGLVVYRLLGFIGYRYHSTRPVKRKIFSLVGPGTGSGFGDLKNDSFY